MPEGPNTLVELTENGFAALVQQNTLLDRLDPDSREYRDEWDRLAAKTRKALRLAAKKQAQELLAKARLLAAVIYKEGGGDLRFELAQSLLRDMGEGAFAERRGRQT